MNPPITARELELLWAAYISGVEDATGKEHVHGYEVYPAFEKFVSYIDLGADIAYVHHRDNPILLGRKGK